MARAAAQNVPSLERPSSQSFKTDFALVKNVGQEKRRRCLGPDSGLVSWRGWTGNSFIGDQPEVPCLQEASEERRTFLPLMRCVAGVEVRCLTSRFLLPQRSLQV